MLSLPPGSQLVVSSRLFPTFTIPVGQSQDASGAPLLSVGGIALKVLQPAVTIQVAGNTLGVIAPAGVPTSSWWPFFKYVLIGAGILVAVKVVL